MTLLLMVGSLSCVTAKAQTITQIDGQPRALLAYLNVQPGTEGQFLEAAKDVIEKSRQEPGTIIYNLHQSITNPTQFVFYELYKSDADLQTHKRSAHVVGFLKNVKAILIPNGFALVEYR